MSTKVGKWMVMLVGFTLLDSVQAHHSMAMFDVRKAIWLKGMVVRYDVANPHVMVVLENRGSDGNTQQLVVEGPNLIRLGRMKVAKDFLKTGDVIEMCGFPFRNPPTDTSHFDARGMTRPVMHGHMVVLPDGHRRLFGAYGKLDNCIRPNDTVDSWVEFLNADPLVHQSWCATRAAMIVPSTAPPGFAEEVGRRIGHPCE